MKRWLLLLLFLTVNCSGSDSYIVEGVVLEKQGDLTILVDHEEVKGLMGSMTMPFDARDERVLREVKAGDVIKARLIIDQQGSYLERVRVTGHKSVKVPVSEIGRALRPGERMPAFPVSVQGRSEWTIGDGQGKPTAVAFLYTRCPIPEFCPALVSRFQALQERVGTRARLLTITLDPEYDTREVLDTYAEAVGAKAEIWQFGRVSPEVLQQLSDLSSLGRSQSSETEVIHRRRMLILDGLGKLIERYDDNNWSLDRVASQLTTGAPLAPAGSDGTLTPAEN